MKQKQIIALVSATALAATALAGCGKTSEENTQTTAVSEAGHCSNRLQSPRNT